MPSFTQIFTLLHIAGRAFSSFRVNSPFEAGCGGENSASRVGGHVVFGVPLGLQLS
jgi:hypothetical protein